MADPRLVVPVGCTVPTPEQSGLTSVERVAGVRSVVYSRIKNGSSTGRPLTYAHLKTIMALIDAHEEANRSKIMKNGKKQFDLSPKPDGFPAHIYGGLCRYLEDGVRPGGFLTCVLENDLLGAISRADIETLGDLEAIVRFIHNGLTPGICCGSRKAVESWINGEYKNWKRYGS